MAALHVVNDEMTITTWYAGDWLLIVMKDIQSVRITQADSDGNWINKAQNRQEYRAFKTKSVARRRYNALIREFGEIKILKIDWESLTQNLNLGHTVIIKREGINLNITTMSDEGTIVSDITLPIGRSEKVAEMWMVTWLWHYEDPCVVFVKDRIDDFGIFANLYLGTNTQTSGCAQTPVEALEEAFNGVYA